MKKLMIVVIIISMTIGILFSQSYRGKGRLKGIVTDTEQNPLEDVRVKLFSLESESGFEVKTDKNGEWQAKWIRSGMWHIDFIKMGYETKKISVKVSEYKRNPLIETEMRKMEGVVITEEVSGRLEEANKYFEEKEYEKAISLYKKIIEDYPEFYIVNKNIGNVYFIQKDYEKAIEYYKKVAEEQQKENQEINILIGNSYVNVKNYEKAMEWYSKADIKEINDVIALYNIGVIFYNNQKYDQALKYLERCIEVDNEYSDAYYQMGMIYLSRGESEKAIEFLDRFLELEPDSDKAPIAREIIDTLRKDI